MQSGAVGEGFTPERALVLTFGLVFTLGAVTFLALSIFKDYGDSWNTFNGVSFGILGQMGAQTLPDRRNRRVERSLGWEKDTLVKYAAIFFIGFTQVYLNVPRPRWFVRLTFGIFGALLGMQMATMVDTIAHWRLEDDKTQGIGYRGDPSDCIPVIMGNRPRSRRAWEVAKVIVAVAAIVIGFQVRGASIALKLGWILLGHSAGVVIHEIIHSLRKRLQRRYEEAQLAPQADIFVPPTNNMPTNLKILIFLEKLEQILGILLPGFIVALNTSYTDAIAGTCMGMTRQIDWIRFTRTPAQAITELARRELSPPTYWRRALDIAKWAFAVIGVGGFLAYGIYDGITNGPVVNAYVLATFGIVLYSSYALTRYLDNQEIPSNRVVNNLFFYTNFSISAPILYIAITQVLQIGDYALDTYEVYNALISCLAWASLAWAFGTQAGHRATNRNVPYPATVDPLIILYTFWFVGLLIPHD